MMSQRFHWLSVCSFGSDLNSWGVKFCERACCPVGWVLQALVLKVFPWRNVTKIWPFQTPFHFCFISVFCSVSVFMMLAWPLQLFISCHALIIEHFIKKKADLSFAVTIPSSSHVLLSSVHFRDSKKKKKKKKKVREMSRAFRFPMDHFRGARRRQIWIWIQCYRRVDGHSVYKQVTESVMTAQQQSCWLFLCNPVLSVLLCPSVIDMMRLVWCSFFFLAGGSFRHCTEKLRHLDKGCRIHVWLVAP